MQHIYRLSGQYLGFIFNQGVFTWNGTYLGWIDNQSFVWNKDGNFAGKLTQRNERNYILKNTFQISPVAKIPRTAPAPPTLPTPRSSAPPIQMPIGWEDAF